MTETKLGTENTAVLGLMLSLNKLLTLWAHCIQSRDSLNKSSIVQYMIYGKDSGKYRKKNGK